MTEGGAPNESSTRPSAWRRWAGRRRLPVLALVVALAAVAWIAVGARSKPSVAKTDVNAIVDKKVSTAIQNLQAAPAPGVGVYDAIRGPLVVIQASGAGNSSELGSGVVVNDKGAILTALHVVQGASSIRVTFSDGTQSSATVQTSDADHDSAVLAADQPPLMIVPAVLGSSNGIRIGDETYAVGNPLGLLGSLSAGVISGLDRSFRLPSGHSLTGLIQFDAAVNPGNSGGPLLNGKGQVIGIVTGLANSAGNGDFAGIGFAVPIGAAGGAAGAPAR